MSYSRITHPLYNKFNPLWTLCEDATSATNVKDKGQVYLPITGDPSDPVNQARYKIYHQRAPYTNYSSQTLSGLVGLAFMEGVTIEGAEGVNEYILDNVNGDGVGLEQLAKRSEREVIKKGRAGLFVDFPRSNGGLTEQQQSELGLNATITTYTAEQILDWSTEKVGNQNVLSFVSLLETTYERDSESGQVETVERERHLFLDDGIYYYKMMQDGKELEDTLVMPVDGQGKALNRIPFYFIGAENNDTSPDQPPMYPICTANINYYVVDADLHNTIYYMQPQYFATGLNQDWVDNNLTGFVLGSGSLYVGPEGSSFGVAEVSSDPLLATKLETIQQNIISLGGKMINSGVSFSTATEAKIATASENSVLKNVTDNVEKAYNMALETLALFNKSSVPTLSIDADLKALTADSEELAGLRADVIAGLIPVEAYRDELRKRGLLDRTEDEVLDLLESAVNIEDVSTAEAVESE